MELSQLNTLERSQLKEELAKCCGSRLWIEKMASVFPVPEEEFLFSEAKHVWYEECDKTDWIDAFSHHPRIGDVSALRTKFASTAEWAEGEQVSIRYTSEEVLETLARWNGLYEEKFGYIFIVCATGKSAEEMLAMLSVRLSNSPAEEIRVAMEEQFKITLIRLNKLLAS